VLFPIYDMQARPAGVGGRVLPGLNPGDMAKYINSPETPLFSKSKLLYGLHAAREAIRSTGVALVMEGYTDCIVAHQYGFRNAVAVLGTALGTPQIRTLAQCGPADRDVRIVLVLDGDDAGRKRTNEVLELFLAENVDLRVLTLPDEADPCEFLLEYGAEAMTRRIDAAPDALNHAIETATLGIDLARDVHGATRALDKLVETISKAPRPMGREDHLREQSFLGNLARTFRVREESLRERMNQLRDGGKRLAVKPAIVEARASVTSASLDWYERELLEIVLKYPAAMAVLAEELCIDWLPSPACRRIMERCLELHHSGVNVDFARLLLEFQDGEVKNLLVELDENAHRKGTAELDVLLRDVLSNFQRREQQRLAKDQVAALKEGHLSHDEELAMLEMLKQQQQTRQGISAPTEG
jgi:DNA primase